MAQNKIKSLLTEVLSEIKPTKQEENEILSKINTIITKIQSNVNAKVILGGSGRKGTWLRNSYDADIFVLFNYKNYKDKSEELSNILEKSLTKIFKITRLHGSRDYFQIKLDSFTIEIIPILEIKKADEALNITDISPLHAQWVNKYRLKDDIRLAKQFCKANNVYGAESYIMGFSGYICEILTIYYGGFLKLIKNAAKWQDKVIIDIEKYYKNRSEVSLSINKSKISGPLIIVDPVQKERNAAAALSKDKFDIFVKKCQEFQKKPSKDFFAIKNTTEESLMEKHKKNSLIIITIDVPEGKKDIIGCKIIKDLNNLINLLKKNDFLVKDSGFAWNKEKEAFYYLFLDKKGLPDEKIIEGPELSLKEHVQNFKKVHKKTYIESKRIYAIEKRKFTKPETLIDNFQSLFRIKNIKAR